jgi:hypothetical protein
MVSSSCSVPRVVPPTKTVPDTFQFFLFRRTKLRKPQMSRRMLGARVQAAQSEICRSNKQPECRILPGFLGWKQYLGISRLSSTALASANRTSEFGKSPNSSIASGSVRPKSMLRSHSLRNFTHRGIDALSCAHRSWHPLAVAYATATRILTKSALAPANRASSLAIEETEPGLAWTISSTRYISSSVPFDRGFDQTYLGVGKRVEIIYVAAHLVLKRLRPETL